ncbi:MAG TPA: DUF4197 domain-containing protein [Ferrovibrio sp.]|jgi:hypothetical protein|uniref:DUF4197 domain-containing protein n=1 Tax=Ferrovibrio sp. TaxID=1917215 RepID=UPI002B4B7A58|nr:DUF4197 domain-containing protein [Ferrovibrio sp.]HLT77548.1 DUF4197 domain-containing protein [Ferrovibrio sp.]
MRTFSRRSVLLTASLLVPGAARAQGLLEQGRNLLKQAPGGSSGSSKSAGSGLSQGEIGSGLKEALSVASRRVVDRTGKVDGFNGDPAIRIPLPGPLQKLEGALKTVGAGGMLSDLQLKMNRAAEQAAPKALDIFRNAISKMSISDAKAILSGPNDAATQYFRKQTSGDLTTAFKPVVDRSLADVGAVQSFKAVQGRASGIPLAGQEVQSLNLTDYTVQKALDGLFHYLGTEEAAIRTNPAARTTDLLKKVFA